MLAVRNEYIKTRQRTNCIPAIHDVLRCVICLGGQDVLITTAVMRFLFRVRVIIKGISFISENILCTKRKAKLVLRHRRCKKDLKVVLRHKNVNSMKMYFSTNIVMRFLPMERLLQYKVPKAFLWNTDTRAISCRFFYRSLTHEGSKEDMPSRTEAQRNNESAA